MGETTAIKRPQAPKEEKTQVKVPSWLVVMHTTIFFTSCSLHENERKNDLDHFCINCVQSLCYHCLPSHAHHRYLKIRRYMYSDVINKQDLNKHFSCSGIQPYSTNKAKVVFLKQRPHQQQQQQQSSLREYSCSICGKSLQDNSLYCSIECKVTAMANNNHKDKYINRGSREEVESKEKGENCEVDKEFTNDGEISEANEEDAIPLRPMRRRRKQVPSRSPFY